MQRIVVDQRDLPEGTVVTASLESSLQAEKAAKYDAGLEENMRAWLEELLETPFDASLKLQEVLRDGQVLCKAFNKMCPGAIPRINSSNLPFKQMENISNYLLSCEQVGFRPTELFETNDLYANKDMMKVLQNLHVLCTYQKKYDTETLVNKHSSGVEKISAAKAKASTPTPPLRGTSSPSIVNKEISSEDIKKVDQMGSGAHVSSLQEDVATKNEFKYNLELEKIACSWVSKVLEEELTPSEFIASLKSGVRLCQLVNKIKPDTIPISVIHKTNIKYHQLENIQHFLTACQSLGLRSTDLFNSTDLSEEKGLHLVINCLIVLANTVKGEDYYKGPIIEDTSKTKNLWAESLVMNELKEDDDADAPAEITPEEQELVDWVNLQLIKSNASPKPIRNLSGSLRSGVALMRLVEVLTGQRTNKWEPEPKYLFQYISNAAAVLTFLSSLLFEQVQGCTARDIVSMNVSAVTVLIKFLRDRFDLDYLFQQTLNEDLQEEEKEMHSHIHVAPAEGISSGDESSNYYEEGEGDEYYDESGYEEDENGEERDETASLTDTLSAPTEPLPEKPVDEPQQTPEEAKPEAHVPEEPKQTITEPVKEEPKVEEPKKVEEPSEAKTEPVQPEEAPKPVKEEPPKTEETPRDEPQKAEDPKATTPREDEAAKPAEQTNPTKTEDTPTKKPKKKKEKGDTPRKKKKKEKEGESGKKRPRRNTSSRELSPRLKLKEKEKNLKRSQSLKHVEDSKGPLKTEKAPQTPTTPSKTKKKKKKEATEGSASPKPKKIKKTPSKASGGVQVASSPSKKKQGTTIKAEEGQPATKEGKKGRKKKGTKEQGGKKEKKKKTKGTPEEAPKSSDNEPATTAHQQPNASDDTSAKPEPSQTEEPKPQPAEQHQEPEEPQKPQLEPPKEVTTPTTTPEDTTHPETTPQAAAPEPKQDDEHPPASEQPASEGGKETTDTQPETKTVAPVQPTRGGAGRGRGGSGRGRGRGPARRGRGGLGQGVERPADDKLLMLSSLKDIQAIKMEKARNVVRKRVAQEILSTEKSYVKSLEILYHQAVEPLLTTRTGILTKTEIANLFWNLPDLLKHHQAFEKLLEERISDWNPSSVLGDIFLNHTEFLDEYKPYLSGYTSSLVTLRHFDKRKPGFSQIKREFEKEQKKTTHLDMESYMIMPVQRIPRYALLLRELVKYTNPLHADHKMVEQAANKINNQLNKLNKGIDQQAAERAQKIHSIEDSIEGEIIPGESLFTPTRKYVREGVMKLKQPGAQSKKEIYFFMFNDILVGCGRLKKEKEKEKEKAGASSGPEFEFLLSLALTRITWIDDRKVEKKGVISLHVEKEGNDKEKEKEKGKEKENENKDTEIWVLECKKKEDRMPWLADLVKFTTDSRRQKGEALRINKKNEF